jgi:hypothetical protein
MSNFNKVFSVTLIFSFLLAGCNFNRYELKDGKIYYTSMSVSWHSSSTLIKEADASSFRTINNTGNIYLGKDKNHIFREASVLEHADPKSFKKINDYYWKDKTHVYLLSGSNVDSTESQIKEADPKTFVVIKNSWTKDKNHVYYSFDNLKNANPKNFEVIDRNWAKDDKYYYFENVNLDSLDYNSVQIVSELYIKDRYRVFYTDKLVKDANPETFKVDKEPFFAHDDRYMFEREENKGLITEQYRNIYIRKK